MSQPVVVRIEIDLEKLTARDCKAVASYLERAPFYDEKVACDRVADFLKKLAFAVSEAR